jgi:hypothetical protein
MSLRDATSRAEVDRVLDAEEVLTIAVKLQGEAAQRFAAARTAALTRFPPVMPDDELPPIAGEEKVMAGD